jgi:hypothetical protein
MTGREKILAAFTPRGTPEIGVVSCYEELFIRDHYAALTAIPWWDPTGVPSQAKDFYKASGLEWFAVGPCPSRDERARQRHERRADGMWLIDVKTGKETRLLEPTASGTNTTCAHSRHTDVDALPSTREEIDALIPVAPDFDRGRFLSEGRHEVAFAVRAAVELLLYSHIISPVWSLHGLLGYEGMRLIAFSPGKGPLPAGAGRPGMAADGQGCCTGPSPMR